MFSTGELADIYAELGQTVTYRPPQSGTPISGLATYSAPGSELLGGEVIATEPVLRYAVSVFPAVVRGGVFEIGAKDFKVRTAPRFLADGMEALVALEAV